MQHAAVDEIDRSVPRRAARGRRTPGRADRRRPSARRPRRTRRAAARTRSRSARSRQSTIAIVGGDARAAPFAIALEQRREQRRDRAVIAARCAAPERRHRLEPIEQLAQPLGVGRPGRRFGVVFGEMQRSGSRNASSREAVLARSYPGSIRTRRSSASVIPSSPNSRGASIAAADHALADRGDRLGRACGCALRRRRSGRTGAETDSGRGRRTSASARASPRPATAANSGVSSRSACSSAVPGRDRVHQQFDGGPGAPVKPLAGPMPSISSQRGQDCDGWPFSARSMTRFAIFSTTCRK